VKAFAVAHAEELIEMVADQGEKVGDAEVLERGDEEFCAVGHGEVLVYRCGIGLRPVQDRAEPCPWSFYILRLSV